MKTVKLGDVCEFKRGLTYKKTDEAAVSDNIVLRANNIDLATFKLNFDELKYISDTIEIPESKHIRKDTILICTASGSKSHLGKVALVDRDYGFAFGGFMGLIVPDLGKIDANYLYKVLISKPFRDLIDSLTDGANINNLKFSLIENFEFTLPSLEEQRRVVAKLDAAFEQISAAEVLMRRNLDNVTALQKSILHKYLSADDSAHTHRLGDVCAIVSRLVDPKIMPFLNQLHVGAANIISNTGELIDLKTSKEEKLISGKFPFDNRMVLYSKIRPYLKKVVRPDFDGICSADIYPLLPNDNLNRDYLYYLLTSADFTEYAIVGSQRAGMPKVNREHLFEYRFNLPTIDIQEKIVDKLNTALSKSRELESQYTKKLTKLTDLRQSLLQEAFSTTK